MADPIRIHGYARQQLEVRKQVLGLLEEVDLTPGTEFIEKFPHELSGGQRQRVAVARALGAHPEVLIADEPVSMLDVSIRLSVLNLLGRMARGHDVAMLYITHDIASARYFADAAVVMYAGQLAEGADAETLTQSPCHPCTRLLIDAAPGPSKARHHALPVVDRPAVVSRLSAGALSPRAVPRR